MTTVMTQPTTGLSIAASSDVIFVPNGSNYRLISEGLQVTFESFQLQSPADRWNISIEWCSHCKSVGIEANYWSQVAKVMVDVFSASTPTCRHISCNMLHSQLYVVGLLSVDAEEAEAQAFLNELAVHANTNLHHSNN